MTYIIVCEGRSETTKSGFEYLLNPYSHSQIQVVCAGDAGNAIKLFKGYLGKGHIKPMLLVDLDGKSKAIDADKVESKKKWGLLANSDVYFMVQEMEAWMLSQHPSHKDRLAEVYSMRKPSEFLKDNAGYKKCDGSKWLKKLDRNRLMQDFEDFKRLVEQLPKG